MKFNDIPTEMPGIEQVTPIRVKDFADLASILPTLEAHKGEGFAVAMEKEAATLLSTLLEAKGLFLKAKNRWDGQLFVTCDKTAPHSFLEAEFHSFAKVETSSSSSSSKTRKSGGKRMPRGWGEETARKFYENLKNGNAFMALPTVDGFSSEQALEGLSVALRKGKLLEKASLFLEANPANASEYRLKWIPDGVGRGRSLPESEYKALQAAWEKDHKAGKADSWLVGAPAPSSKAPDASESKSDKSDKEASKGSDKAKGKK